MSQFFYSTDGTTRVGPIEHDALVNLVRIGMLSPATLIWREGYPAWTPAAQTPELAALFANPAPEAAADPVVADAPATPDVANENPAAFTPPTMPGPMSLPRTSGADGMAIAALVIGICSLMLFACINVFGIPLPIIGLILAKISKTPGGVRTAAIVINAVSLALLLAILVFMLVT